MITTVIILLISAALFVSGKVRSDLVALCALLSLLLGQVKCMHLSLGAGSAEVRDICTKVRLDENCTSARVELSLTAVASPLSESELEKELTSKLLALLTRLSAAGCDVLGLGRQAIMGVHEVCQWYALEWPERYRNIRWEVAVGIRSPA